LIGCGGAKDYRCLGSYDEKLCIGVMPADKCRPCLSITAAEARDDERFRKYEASINLWLKQTESEKL